MLWKLFSSDERIEKALQKSAVSRDLSPPIIMAANANEEYRGPLDEEGRPKSRLWLEDWSEKDEERVRDDRPSWDTTIRSR